VDAFGTTVGGQRWGTMTCSILPSAQVFKLSNRAAQEWVAIAVDTAMARRSTVPRRLGSSIFMDDS
jgi:hypothetical protein